MTRVTSFVAFAFGCAALTAYAQDTTTTVKSETKSSGGEVKTVTYTGCVHEGEQAATYVLDKVVPVGRTTTTDATGATSTTTTYMLVPGERVDMKTQVGHKVEVTGMLIPAGKVTSETKTTVDREDAKDTKSSEKVSTKNPSPQFRVTSIKSLAESCN
jgi:hypothetical protein